MAHVEKSGFMVYKSSSGDTTTFYPNTLANNVSGLDTAINNFVGNTLTDINAHLTNKTNPHEVTAEQVGALSSTPVSMASTDGTTYTCTVPGITELTAGASFIGIPAIVSTSTSVTLNVNNLGAKQLRRGVSTSSSTTTAGYNESWLAAGKPLRIMYDGLFWIVDNARPYAADLMGTVPIANGGTGASDGAAGLANLFAAGSTVLSSNQYGETLPTAGSAGRVFFKKSDGSDMEAINAHITDENNPHKVTAAQVGADTSGSAATVQSNLTTHISDENNPHNVTAAQVGALSSTPIDMLSDDGVTYTCTIPWITEVTKGACFIGVPGKTSTSTKITLNVNNLGARSVRVGCSDATGSSRYPSNDNWLTAAYSTKIMFSGSFWIVERCTRPAASDLIGDVNKANYATDTIAVGTPALRNQYFVSAEATPTVNGQIAWVYG